MARANVPLRRIRLCTTEQSLAQPPCQRGGPYDFEHDAAPVEKVPDGRGTGADTMLDHRPLGDLLQGDVLRLLDQRQDDASYGSSFDRPGCRPRRGPRRRWPATAGTTRLPWRSRCKTGAPLPGWRTVFDRLHNPQPEINPKSTRNTHIPQITQPWGEGISTVLTNRHDSEIVEPTLGRWGAIPGSC